MKLRMFTDGACSGNPGPGGWATAFAWPKIIKLISGNDVNTTNNRMELTAVLEGIKYALDKLSEDDCLEVHSDSAYVVNSIVKQWIVKWKINGWTTADGKQVKNSDLWIQLNELLQMCKKQNVTVTFVKVKGHSGISMNEMVDSKAREESIKAKMKVEVERDDIL